MLSVSKATGTKYFNTVSENYIYYYITLFFYDNMCRWIKLNYIDEAILNNIPKTRPIVYPFKWVGSKVNMLKFILEKFPKYSKDQIYVEPFCGTATVFLNLPKPYCVEVLNDLDGNIINFFRVLQDKEKFDEFLHRIIWTPYSRDEFKKSLEIKEKSDKYSDIDRAWAFFVGRNQGINGFAETEGNWGRVFVSNYNMSGNVRGWKAHTKHLIKLHERLSSAQLDSRDALTVIKYWDTDRTIFYIDPPYVQSTRSKNIIYSHEMNDKQHKDLIDVLLNVNGKVILSGYDSEIYHTLESNGWNRFEKNTLCHISCRTRNGGLKSDGSGTKDKSRKEIVWTNFKNKLMLDSWTETI